MVLVCIVLFPLLFVLKRKKGKEGKEGKEGRKTKREAMMSVSITTEEQDGSGGGVFTLRDNIETRMILVSPNL